MEELNHRAGGMFTTVRETASLVMFQHTIFALPFALIGMFTASAGGWPTPAVWFWVAVAMVGARTAAMAFNRLADHPIDALNPRTAGRSLPAGRLSRPFAWVVVALSCLVFALAAGALNRLCLILALPTLAVLLGYSFAKRFTSLAHLWLGVALGLAPIGAWIAVAGELAWPPVVLGLGVSAWVTGFDIIYSLQDEGFDRQHQLRSLPADLGGRTALEVARLAHLVAVCCFAAFALIIGGGWIRFAAVAAAGALIITQHLLVRPDDLRRVNAAFFTANGVLAILMSVLFAVAKQASG